MIGIPTLRHTIFDSNYITDVISTIPVNVVAPELSDSNPNVGMTIYCSTGTWNPPADYTYQWLKNGSPVGAQGPVPPNSYFIGNSDVNSSISCVVTATNIHGSTSVESNLVYIVH